MSNIIEKIINNYDIALIAFNPNGDLIFYNKEAQSLWQLEKDILDYKPNIIEFYEILRETGRYPEKDDFRSYIQGIYNTLYQKTAQKKTYRIILDHSCTLTEIHRYSNLGVLISWEDSTEDWNNIYALNSFKNIYNRIINNNPKPILIISTTGAIETYNGKFLEEFSINATYLDNLPHVRDLINKITILEKYPSHINNIIGHCVTNRSFIYKADLDNDDLYITGISLPNGTMFVIFDVYDKKQNNFDLKYLPEPLIKNITSLQNNLILDLSSIIINPVASIIGFADMLKNEYVGSLNIRQHDYISNILKTAENINTELSNKTSLINLEKVENVEIKEIDIMFCISTILHEVTVKLQKYNVKLNLECNKLDKKIISNSNLLCKAVILLFNYMIEQNNNNSEVLFKVYQDNRGTHIVISDTAKHPLLSKEDLAKRYDLKLATFILNQLQITIKSSYKNKSYRELVLLII